MVAKPGHIQMTVSQKGAEAKFGESKATVRSY